MRNSRKGLQVTLALLAAATIVTAWTDHGWAEHRSMPDGFVGPGRLDPNAEDGSGEPDVSQNSRHHYPRGPIGADASGVREPDWLRWFVWVFSNRGSWSGR
jgi:hypothetical protein